MKYFYVIFNFTFIDVALDVITSHTPSFMISDSIIILTRKELQTVIVELQTENLHLTKSLTEVQREVNKLVENLKGKSQPTFDHSIQSQSTNEKLQLDSDDNLLESLNESQTRVKQLADKIQEKLHKFPNYSNQTQIVTDKLLDLISNNESLNKALNNQKEQQTNSRSDETQGQLVVLQLEIERLTEVLNESQLKNKELQSEIQTIQLQNHSNQTSMTRLEQQQKELQLRYKELKNHTNEESQELQRTKQQLDMRTELLNQWTEQLKKREQETDQLKLKYEKWQQTLSLPTNIPAGQKSTSSDLMNSVKEAHETVTRDKEAVQDKQIILEQTKMELEELKAKLVASEDKLKQRQLCFEGYIALVEQQGLLPESRPFHNLLKSTKHGYTGKKMKCFISYAWNPDNVENAKLQAKLAKMKADLVKAGFEVLLDIHNMEGDIDKYMLDGINQSDRVLLVSFIFYKKSALFLKLIE